MKNYFVVAGKIPPPLGGVRVHVERLIAHLKKNKFNFSFLSLSECDFWPSLRLLWHAKFVHLHTSSVWGLLAFSLFCFISRRKLVFTYHGNVGRYGKLKNFFDYCSIKLAYLPIVLNDESLRIARKFNSNARLISAFIPPVEELESGKEPRIDKLLLEFKTNFKFVYCTNACVCTKDPKGITYDSKGQEVYGISSLVKIFNSKPDLCLIVSDPSGKYSRFFKENNILLGKNIVLLDFPHSFARIINNTDCFLRATTTDGDSISVREALHYKKPVIASDCVQRPDECVLYPTSDFKALGALISQFPNESRNLMNGSQLSGLDELFYLYKTINGEQN